MKKIVVVSSEGQSREDGNVYYSRYLLVESLSLAFDEPVFSEPNDLPGDGIDEKMSAVSDKLRELGYIIHDIESIHVSIPNYG